MPRAPPQGGAEMMFEKKRHREKNVTVVFVVDFDQKGLFYAYQIKHFPRYRGSAPCTPAKKLNNAFSLNNFVGVFDF